MIVKTGRFGQVEVSESEVIHFPEGILGFPNYQRFCLVDPGDDTLIFWLQSIDHPSIAFPLLEPKIFKPEYMVRLSAAELRELRLENVNQSAVFAILTIPEDVTQMTANLKAPLVVNLKLQIGRQVILQENEYSIKHVMFKELKAHLITIQSQIEGARTQKTSPAKLVSSVLSIQELAPSLTVKSLQP